MAKLWGALLFFVALVIVVDIIKIAVTPYLPVIGFIVVAAVVYLVIRFIRIRRDHW